MFPKEKHVVTSVSMPLNVLSIFVNLCKFSIFNWPDFKGTDIGTFSIQGGCAYHRHACYGLMIFPVYVPLPPVPKGRFSCGVQVFPGVCVGWGS